MSAALTLDPRLRSDKRLGEHLCTLLGPQWDGAGQRLVTGQPASIKYDPANPSDSIIVADDWSGLR